MNIYKKILSFLFVMSAVNVGSCHGMYFFKKSEPKPPFDPVKAICISLAEKGKAFYRKYPKTSWTMGISAAIIAAYWTKLYFDQPDINVESRFTPGEQVVFQIDSDRRVLNELILNKKSQFLSFQSNASDIYYKKLACEIDQKLHEEIALLLHDYRQLYIECKKQPIEKNFEQFKAKATEITDLIVKNRL